MQWVLLLVFLVGLLIGGVGVGFYSRLKITLHNQAESIREIKKRLDDEPKTRRRTYNDIALFEDATAISLDTIADMLNSQKYAEARLVQMLNLLREGRESPHAYDIERVAGPKPKNRNGGKYD
jgi:gas vesicle protein